ncbi:predicted protein [Lichtheimia corymbifera JMRC:FSU:9682]|uniref:Heterokaryon incompatibility domain-containing protein n=1 Tax=Lichtheimia corymbifera JMRC:FSU:9682 TaxID=1263082 RepID=A0A068RV38_9FUNG|nr:predicted protein [Lichtheimia corymbifera JMRC:FSU:9682]
MTITSTSKDPPAVEFDKVWTLEDTFTHAEFRLLYVPPKDEHGKMMIITPSKHEPSYVPDRKFYALSHLWGTDPKDNLWEVSDFISDEDGTTVDPIPMRKEKRKTLVNLLQKIPGYWWIDVLCCRTDLPPVIMRGVYGCCHTCFAMIDCDSRAFYDVLYIMNRLPHFSADDLEYAREYARRIWKCRWFSRVWTLQELALPSSVILLSETCGMPCDSHSIDAESLSEYMGIISYYLAAMRKSDTNVRDLSNELDVTTRAVQGYLGLRENDGIQRIQHLSSVLALFAKSGRSCYFAEDYVYGALGILGWDIPRLNNIQDLWDRFLSSLQHFTVKLLWQGMKNSFPENTIKHLQETIHIRISQKAQSYALSAAYNMADVYKGLLYITLNCSCSKCRYVAFYITSICGYIKVKIVHK